MGAWLGVCGSHVTALVGVAIAIALCSQQSNEYCAQTGCPSKIQEIKDLDRCYSDLDGCATSAVLQLTLVVCKQN